MAAEDFGRRPTHDPDEMVAKPRTMPHPDNATVEEALTGQVAATVLNKPSTPRGVLVERLTQRVNTNAADAERIEQDKRLLAEREAALRGARQEVDRLADAIRTLDAAED